jgi:hypothetical protein
MADINLWELLLLMTLGPTFVVLPRQLAKKETRRPRSRARRPHARSARSSQSGAAVKK